MDINFDFTILDVPNEDTALAIRDDIQEMLKEKHGTEMWISYTDVTF